MVKIPKIKKEVRAFLTKEDGKMTKENLVKAGIVIAAFSAAASLNSSDVSAQTHTSNCNEGWVSGGCGTDPPDGWSCTDGLAAGNNGEHDNDLDFNVQGNDLVSSHGHCADTFQWDAHSSHTSHSSCCFPEDSMVATPSGTKPIQDIRVGETVLAYDFDTKKLEEATVEELETPMREGIYIINNGFIKVTNDHPFYTKKKDNRTGWAAIDKEHAEKSYQLGQIMSLKVGDFIFNKDSDWVEIKSLEYVEGDIQTYNLKRVSRNRNYFVEGLLVHNKYY